MRPRIEIYGEIVRRVEYSKGDFIELGKTKSAIKEEFTGAFSSYSGFSDLKFIGSCATRNCVKWKKDIDGVVLLNPFSAREFRDRVQTVNGLEKITFADKCLIVGDKFDAEYNRYEVSIGCVDSSLSPYNSLGADLIRHPDFVAGRLTDEQVKDVLLTKVFLKNIGLYGKKVGGFAAEQIVIYFDNFDNFTKHLRVGKRIFIDFSGKYSGQDSPLVVSYPYCGLDNLVRISDEDFETMINYARKILDRPELFLEDSCSTVNRLFWEKRARTIGDKEELSMPDVHLNHRENKIFKKRIIGEGNGLRVLDVGCANGYSTIAINRGTSNSIIGIDSNKKLIEIARSIAKRNGLDTLEFLVSDASSIPFEDSFFDVVYAKRAISNLPSRKKQEESIMEIGRVLKKGGLFLFSDLLEGGYEHINKLRSVVGLTEIKLPYHGNLLREEDILRITKGVFTLECIDDFSSTYYFLSRVVYPKLLELGRMNVRSDSKANKLFSKLPSLGNIGINKLYLLRRNGN